MQTTSSQRIYKMVLAALLCAVAIVVPIISPLKIQLEPASFTLGSHVAIMIAMFISPVIAVAVNIGATIGFFLAGFPLVIVARAASQVLFAYVGGKYIQKHKNISLNPFCAHAIIFNIIIGIIHGASEVVACIPFYVSGQMQSYLESGFFVGIMLLVGCGTVVHSMVDFFIAGVIWKPLRHTLRN